ncbi:MAG: hypothetical protein KAX37_02015 [Opitutaceae bacterium]|nr:hypothetical protein [Opitutaceae bacterium]
MAPALYLIISMRHFFGIVIAHNRIESRIAPAFFSPFLHARFGPVRPSSP